MRAVVVDGFGVQPRVAEVPEPQAPADGVVVRVEASGLCRSDWHGWIGHDPDIALPHVPGHEFVGRVLSRGSQVSRVAVGSRVLTPFVCGCGTCQHCRAGNAQICPDQTQPGFTHWGSFAEQVVVRHADHNAVEVAEDIHAADLVGLGCRFATSYRGLRDRAGLRAGERLAVFGCGGVGLSAVMIGRALGAEILAVDTSDGALALAKQHGAAHTVNSTDLAPADLAADLRRRWPDIAVSVDAVGSAAIATAALLSLAPLGRHLQIGLLDTDPELPIGRVIGAELSLLGSHGMAAIDYPGMLALIADGGLSPSALVTRRITLEEAPQALASMTEQPVAGMTIIVP